MTPSLYEERWELYEEPQKTYSFMEVVKQLKEGKKFERKKWTNSYVRILHGNVLRIREDLGYCLSLEDFEAADWIEVK